MKVLFIGDSITSGKIGESYVNLISQQSKNAQINNLGVNGDTINVIFNRLVEHLKKKSDYDCIVIQGGYNDILLPSFIKKGTLFEWAYQQQIKKGLLPFSVMNDLSFFLEEKINQVKKLYKGKILLISIACVGENLNSNLNLQRNKVNEVLRNISLNNSIFWVNTQKIFDQLLKEKNQSNYCLDSFWAVTFWDKLKINSIKLGKERGLHLTIDGVHLNKNGAEIYAKCILASLEIANGFNKNSNLTNNEGN